MHTADPATRAAFIAGLHALADFLATHSDLPVPAYGSDVVNARGTDDEQRAEVQNIAALLDVTPDDEIHFRARRRFGPIEYRAVAVPSVAMASYQALMTYADSVTPDNGTAGHIPDRKEAPPFP
jgi:hypothetical protein